MINSGIKNDVETKVGQIIAATPTSNFMYLISKTISNFTLLLTIVFIIFIMSIVLFFLYNDGYPFQIVNFIKPYAIITIPAMFLLQVWLYFLKYYLQNMLFYKM
ncbi:hypothetical protein [Polaribacter batillariae]|uniref:hypothetical protein n=1 Tax=Polaribacter batillariae TaxID=2808900 RepID=UPI001FB0FDFC|nr:hypothetical protein [Polaribacter batillariae]